MRMRNQFVNREEISVTLQQRRDIQKANHDQHSRDLPPLVPGQNVLIQTHPSSLWSPEVVHEKCQEPRSYVPETPDGRMLCNRRHIQEVEPAKKAMRSMCEHPNCTPCEEDLGVKIQTLNLYIELHRT